jgi:hypothetical protein
MTLQVLNISIDILISIEGAELLFRGIALANSDKVGLR